MTIGKGIHRILDTATQSHATITFKTEAIFNEKAPEPWVAFLLGGIFASIAGVLWVRRLMELRSEIRVPLKGSVLLSSMVSATIDSDEAWYTIMSTTAISFVFLGAMQMDFRTAFSIMLGFFALLASGDVLRIIMAFWRYNSLSDVVMTSHMMESDLRTGVSTELKPTNVYEDIGRGNVIVFIVFVTQAILISFVVVIIYDSETYTCLDGTESCPALGTLSSWGLYVLGIFMSCNFLLGPSTNFGQSEQNPAYWLQLLLSAKQNGAKCTWYDSISNKTQCRYLSSNDWTIWVRFALSFLINGVGFHILIHALPIQIATQSSLLGVVFRAVGMMFIIDMDDSIGHTLMLSEEYEDADGNKYNGENETTFHEGDSHHSSEELNELELSEGARKIVEEARAKLDALAQNGCHVSPGLMAGALVLVGDPVDSSSGNPESSGNEGGDVETGLG